MAGPALRSGCPVLKIVEENAEHITYMPSFLGFGRRESTGAAAGLNRLEVAVERS